MFLSVIPNRRRRNPQLFPMLRGAHTRVAQRRAVVAAGLVSAGGALALVIAAVFTLGSPSVGARAAREAGVGRVAHVGKVSTLAPVAALGSAIGDTTLGLRTSYYEPPALADPSRPGIIDRVGWDQPDNFVLVQNGRYYLFSSQSNQPQNVPVRSATVFGQWGQQSDALPDPPAWAVPNLMWAPDVTQFGTRYLLYFTSQLKGSPLGTKCIGDAISTSPAGPYISGPIPLVCQTALGGSIDPRVFVDSNGQAYLQWKSDQNALPNGGPTQVWSQPLSTDGTQLLGSPTAIFGPDETWQQSVVEAPQMVLMKGAYYLFYSGGHFYQPSYAIGVASCAGPLGPCQDTSATPLLASNLQGWGPGEESVFSNASGIWMIYSPWFANISGSGPPRPVAIAHLGFGPNGPYLAAPFQNGSTGVGTAAATRAP